MWLLIPALASSPGWPARAVRDSAVGARHRPASRPTPPSESRDARSARRRPDRSPRSSTRSRHPTRARRPPTAIPADAADARAPARRCWSRAQACDRIQEGSGFVAGARTSSSPTRTSSRASATPRVTTSDGRAARRRRRRVRSGPRPRGAARARARAPGARRSARPASTTAARCSAIPAVAAAPGAGAHRRADRRARHRHLPHRPRPSGRCSCSPRSPRPGDSGGPVVDAGGNVVGVMFAYDISRDVDRLRAHPRPSSTPVLAPVLAGAATATVSTGDCLAE